jgi:hypothetical protein
MFDLFKIKLTTNEVSSSLFNIIMDSRIIDGDYLDDDDSVLITEWKQRILYLARFYDFLDRNGLNNIKWQLISHWVTQNCKADDEREHTLQVIKTLRKIQKINELFDTTSSQEEFTSRWLNTDIFGNGHDLSQMMLITHWCTEHSELAMDILESTLKKVRIIN